MKGKVSKRAVDALIADAKAVDAALFLWDAELPGFGVKATASCLFLRGSVSARRTRRTGKADGHRKARRAYSG